MTRIIIKVRVSSNNKKIPFIKKLREKYSEFKNSNLKNTKNLNRHL
jgi:hypothetical protein